MKGMPKAGLDMSWTMLLALAYFHTPKFKFDIPQMLIDINSYLGQKEKLAIDRLSCCICCLSV